MANLNCKVAEREKVVELEGIADAHDHDLVQRQTDLLRESLFSDRTRGQRASQIE